MTREIRRATSFDVPKMDCPSEEQIIRLRLGDFRQIAALEFDLTARKLTVIHTGETSPIESALDDLGFGAKMTGSVDFSGESETFRVRDERRLLIICLLINFVFFVIESVGGFLSGSIGLVADSLDMLADSLVYTMALMVAGRAASAQKKVAGLSGALQLFLAAFGLIEVLRRTFGNNELPDIKIMIGVSVLALIANVTCLIVLQWNRSDAAHMRASVIFTSNDVIANLGVIIAGIMVMLSGSVIPDLLIATIVFALVVRGALAMLRLAR